MCSIGLTLSVLPLQEIMSAVDKLLTPIVTDMQKVLNQCQQSPNIDDETVRTHMASQLSMLAMLFATLDVNLKRNDPEEEEQMINKTGYQTSDSSKNPQPIYFILEKVIYSKCFFSN